MTISVEKASEKLKNKKIKLFGGKKINFLATKLGNLFNKAKAKINQMMQEQHDYYVKRLIEKQEQLQELENKTVLSEEDKYNIEDLESEIDALASKIEFYETKLAKNEEETVEFSADINRYFPDLTYEEQEKLNSYYDEEKGIFKIGNTEFNPDVPEEEKHDVYSEIIKEFRKMEATKDMQVARYHEAIGIAAYGEDFIRFMSGLDAYTRKKMF